LARGTHCVFPVASPPALGSYRALNPFQSQQNVAPFNHTSGKMLSPTPTNQESVPATPNTPMTISLRPKGDFALPHGHPSMKGAIAPSFNPTRDDVALVKTTPKFASLQNICTFHEIR